MIRRKTEPMLNLEEFAAAHKLTLQITRYTDTGDNDAYQAELVGCQIGTDKAIGMCADTEDRALKHLRIIVQHAKLTHKGRDIYVPQLKQ